MRFYRWLAWGLFASCVVLTLLSLSVMYLGDPHRIVGRLDYLLVFLPCAAVGALVASRRPENPVGWLFCIVAITNAVRMLAQEYGLYAYAFHPGPLPGEEVAAWLMIGWISSLGNALTMTFVPLLFPTGRLLSRRWRLVAYLAAFACGLQAFGLAFEPGPVDSSLPHIQNPLGIGEAAGVFSVLARVGSALVFLMLLVCVGSLVLRFRRARGEERQQIKWFAYAVVVLTVLVLASLLNSIIQGSDTSGTLWGIVFDLGIVGIPTAVGISILKYRLYDIDVVINRTLVYGVLTASLIVIYLGGVVTLQYVFRTFTGGESQLAVVASTLAIAALSNTLRGRIQSFIDRRFYRRKYDARKTLEEFGSRLREETDLDALKDHLIGVVRETMQPAHTSLWLMQNSESRRT